MPPLTAAMTRPSIHPSRDDGAGTPLVARKPPARPTVKILVDSHVLLWWLDDPRRIALPTRALIADPANVVFFSAASVWEIGLKSGKGKLRIDGDIVAALQADGFEPLPVTTAHAAHSLALPDTHGDPFDRMLIAQALADGLVLATRDRLILQYDVPTVEA